MSKNNSLSKHKTAPETLLKHDESAVTRRNFIKTGAAAGSMAMLARPSRAARLANANGKKTKKRAPNIVFIISDQLNIDAIARYKEHFKDVAYGGHWVRTPNLDRLAQEGYSFIESQSCDPVCSPSRSCIFTGRMASETGVVHNNIGIAKDVPNIGQWFEAHTDYRRIYCGKWHLGGHWNYPTVSGPRRPPGWDVLPVGGSGVGIYVDPQVADSASAFIANDVGDTPYLLVASLMNPHDICYFATNLDGKRSTPESDIYHLGEKLPILPPNFHYHFEEPPGQGPYDGFHGESQWRNYIYDYYRMVEQVDEHVGRIMKAIRERNDDTLVVFTADHGEALARHHRIEKWHPFQPSEKVPFIVWSPKRVKSGVLDTDHMICNVDIISTFCDYAGIEPPPLHRGFSVRPIVDIEGVGVHNWRQELYTEWQITGRTIRTKRYKWAMRYRYSGDFHKPFIRKSDGVHTQFVPGHGEDYEEYPEQLLFDLESDPWELNNLVKDLQYASVIKQHREILREWEAKLIPGKNYNRN